MSERNKLIVKDNRLVREARYDLTLSQQKFVLYIISKIEKDDPPDKVYSVSVKEICSLLDIGEIGSNYRYLKAGIDALASKAFWLYERSTNATVRLQWLEHIKIYHGSEVVSFQFDPSLRPYLFALRNNFTAFELRDILQMKSKYAIRLYEILRSYAFIGMYEVELEELKNLLMATSYTSYDNFRRKVLEVAIDDINYCTTLLVSYTSQRRNRRVARLIFDIKDVGYRNPVEEFIYDHQDDNAT